ncbi:uncharacterized protein LOC114803721 [Zeugodacus cucurbitae]|uniref:uncharacterized protein LOC114803721 n=1 Tax=Zeugodacus cucurbitae TaxID=28588 RepID=UPI0023D9613E|nr:uncharacterized protein LOC114803721 [Zeugodacus cucurbitae]
MCKVELGREVYVKVVIYNIKQVMGQLSSHHDKRNNENRLSTATHFSNRSHSIRKSKVHNNSHSQLEPTAEESSLLRVGNPRLKGLANGRPVTISEIGKRIDLNTSDIFSSSKDKDTSSVGDGVGVGIGGIGSGADGDDTWSNSNLLTTAPATAATPNATTPTPSTDNISGTAGSGSVTVTDGSTTSKNKTTSEHLTIGDRYHKTNNCYYRSPNGNFHKLPSDSYHKMTDGCYVRAADGTFRRIEPPCSSSITNGGGGSNGGKLHQRGDASGSSTRLKNHMLRFLRRSKSHTPATLKELEKERGKADKEGLKSKRGHKARYPSTIQENCPTLPTGSGGKTPSGSNITAGSRNNKVVVTMMEGGGLPIIATSKAERSKNKDSTTSNTADGTRSGRSRMFQLPTLIPKTTFKRMQTQKKKNKIICYLHTKILLNEISISYIYI